MTNVIPNLPNPFPGFQNQPQMTAVVSVTNASSFRSVRAGRNGIWICFVLDESGSMASCWDQTIQGFNEYTLGQRNQPGNCWMSLTKFDSPRVIHVFEKRPIAEVPALDRNNYRPNGGTNLVDAVGDVITKANEVLLGLKKKDRPAVLITIITDGAENSSSRFNTAKVNQMIKSCEAGKWTFTYLGANQNAWATAQSLGIAQTHAYTYSTANMAQTMSTISNSTARYRAAVAKGVDTSQQDFYNAAERSQEVK